MIEYTQLTVDYGGQASMDLRKNMRAGDIIDYSLDIYKANFKKYFLLVIIFHVPATFIIRFLMGNVNLFISELMSLTIGSNTLLIDFLLYEVGSLLNTIYAIIFVNVLSVAATRMSYDLIIYNRTVTTGNLFKYGFGKFGWLILAYIIEVGIITVAVLVVFFLISTILITFSFGVITIVACVLIVLVTSSTAIYFFTRMSLAGAAVSIDGVSLFKGIKASYRFTKGRFWKMFFSLFFTAILFFLVSDAFSLIALFIPFESSLINRIMFAVTSSLSALFFPFPFLVMSFLYTKFKAESGELFFQFEIDKMLADHQRIDGGIYE